MKKVKLILALITVIGVNSFAQTTTWSLDPAHSKIGFSVTHLVISEVEGKFNTFDAKVVSTKSDFADSKVEFTADVNSIDTDNADRDKHLRSPDFFDAAKYDKLKFVSKSFKKVSGNNYKLVGDITIKGVTKPITLDVTYGGIVKDPYGNTKAGFKVKGNLNRKDFGLAWNALTEAGGAVVGDEITLLAHIELQSTERASE